MTTRPTSIFNDERGQTVIDYAIGVSIFLVVVGGVFLIIPTVFEPFSTGTTTETIIADNTATVVSKDLLMVDTSGDGVDVVCAAALFSGNTSLDGKCGFDAGASLEETLGVSSTTDVEMYVTGTNSASNSGVISKTVEGKEYTFHRATGSDKRNTVIATRIVSIEGELYQLVVEVW